MLLAIVFVGILFLVLGVLFVVKPASYIKIIQWQMRIIWAGRFASTKATKFRVRLLGILFLILGTIILCTHLVLGYA